MHRKIFYRSEGNRHGQ